MFAESLLESGNVHHKGRGWATTLSITIQALLLAALVALPIFRPDKILLESRTISAPIAFGRPEAPPHTEQQRSASSARPLENALQPPREIPTHIFTGPVSSNRPDAPPIPCVINCNIGPGDPTGVIGSTRLPVIPMPTAPVKPTPRPVVSVLELGALTHQVQPLYPDVAKRMRLEGTVVIRALVDRDGRIASVQVLSGNPFFVDSASSAVSQWRYRPYLLNGQPVEVETQITVNFKLNQ
jgi:periplasmic protein TonB